MIGNRNAHTGEMHGDVRQKHEWVMVGGFTLLLDVHSQSTPKDCMLEPVAMELKGFGIEEALLKEMCAQVEHAGEQMRAACPDGRLEYINVRVYLSRQVMHAVSSQLAWKYFITRQIASSESDNLNGIDDPRCYIDLHVYQQ
jgi:hypothetical protein